MRKVPKIIFFAVMGLLELIFLSWIFASNLPRRSADLDALSRYQKTPTKENEELWLHERKNTQNELILRKSVGGCLALGNLILIVWVARKCKRPSQFGGTTEARVDV